MADAEAHVMPDGRLYMVGSTDVSGSKDYCSKEYHIWSTDDPELNDWVDHGAVFRNDISDPQIPWSPGTTLYAPDMAYKDGKYYLFICGMNALEAVASADSPAGPYGNVKRIGKADKDGIDPTVLVDDDGSVYYLWGQFHLRGMKLKDNMCEAVEESYTDNILTEEEHGFHEGASIRKINGKYYIIYTDISRGKATCMSYAVSDRPLGPYKKGGVIIDNVYCDPQTWNDHGSIQYYGGRWFVFYHRSTQNGVTCRRVCAEPITVLPDGSIPEVEMTSNGAGAPINAFERVDASLACRMKGSLYITPDPITPGAEILTDCGGGNWAEAWAEYKTLDLKNGAKRFAAEACGKGSVTVMTGGGKKIGSVSFDCGKRTVKETTLSDIPSGNMTVWMLFEGKLDFISFRFIK